MDLEKFEHAITKYGTPLKERQIILGTGLGKAQDCVLQSKQILF